MHIIVHNYNYIVCGIVKRCDIESMPASLWPDWLVSGFTPSAYYLTTSLIYLTDTLGVKLLVKHWLLADCRPLPLPTWLAGWLSAAFMDAMRKLLKSSTC